MVAPIKASMTVLIIASKDGNVVDSIVPLSVSNPSDDKLPIAPPDIVQTVFFISLILICSLEYL